MPVAEASARPMPQAFDVAFMAILRIASDIESERSRIEEWYRCDPIRELGEMTAQQLVSEGDIDLVIDFLQAIGRGDRG